MSEDIQMMDRRTCWKNLIFWGKRIGYSGMGQTQGSSKQSASPAIPTAIWLASWFSHFHLRERPKRSLRPQTTTVLGSSNESRPVQQVKEGDIISVEVGRVTNRPARQFQTVQFQDHSKGTSHNSGKCQRQQVSGPQGGTSWDLLTLWLRVHAGIIAEGILNITWS